MSPEGSEGSDGLRSGLPPIEGRERRASPQRDRRRALRAYVAAVVIAGAAMLLVVVRLAGPDIGEVPLFAGFTVLIVLSSTFPLLVLRKEETESLELEDGILVAMLLLLPQSAVVIAFALGIFIGDSLRRLAPVKVVFNAAQLVLAGGSGVLVFGALVGSGAPLYQQLLGALTAAVVFFCVNNVLVATVLALADGQPFTKVLLDGGGFAAAVWAGGVSVGLLVGLAGSTEPWALVLALVPAVALRFAFASQLRSRRDHERMNGLLVAATRIHASVDLGQVRIALGDAAAELLRCRTSRIGSRPPGPGELGARLPVDVGLGEWLVVGDRRGIEPFEPADQASLEALTAVGASALSNATLFEQKDLDRLRLAESMDKLGEAEAKYRTLVEQIPSIVYTAEFGSAGAWRYVSPNIGPIVGFPPHEWLADPELWFRQLHPEDRERALAEEAESKRSGQKLTSEYRLLTRDGRVLWFLDEAVVVRDEDGEPLLLQGVLYDITERKRAEEEVRTLNAELEQRVAERTAQLEAASQAKSEFLSGMSHELRTPLNAILGFGQLLEMDPLSAEQAESVQQILRGGHHLLELINEVLDIARIEAGRIALSFEPVDVVDVLRETLDLLGPVSAERRVVFVSELPEVGQHRCRADARRLRQILMNLLSNAVKYNREGGQVTVRCAHVAEDLLRIAVSDQGPGIASEDVERLFTPFDRLGAEEGSVEGTGLGLALSKRLVEAMGGTIGVESEPGRGSTFFVDLPLDVDPVGASTETDASGDKVRG
jgi:PAS domain S-box-containing protein